MADDLNSRIDRIEQNLEKVVVVLEGLALSQQDIAKAHAETEQALKHFIEVTEIRYIETTEKLDAVIKMMDEWISRNPPPPPRPQ